MGYKKLDQVMELLTDELDGFDKSITRLEKLTENVENIKIKSDTSKIERMLLEYLELQKQNNLKLKESLQNMEERIVKARLIPKFQLWLHYSIWFVTLVIIGYLSFKVFRTSDIQQRAFAEGEQQVISNLKEYFDNNPEQYQAYQKWIKDNVPNQK